MARTKQKNPVYFLTAPSTKDRKEVRNANPLEDNKIENPESLIIKVTLTTSSPTLSLSNPDPAFGLILSYEVFHSPRPGYPVTVMTGPPPLETPFKNYDIAFRLECTTNKRKSLNLLQPHSGRTGCQRPRVEPETIDLKKSKRFISILEEGAKILEHPLPLERILSTHPDLKPGTRYKVWMKQAYIDSMSYWGDLEGELKDRRLSVYTESGQDNGELNYVVLESDGWAFQIPNEVYVRGNVGRNGPEFELVE